MYSVLLYFFSDADSDEEISNEIVGDKHKEAVFEFFNTGKVAEFQLMQGCSRKKAETICSLRPFENWTDLVR